MTRGICVISEEETRKGPWSVQEDVRLIRSIISHGGRRWNRLAEASGLNRSGKSCRLRWLNYLRPGLKRGRMTPDEERLILELHTRWGNRWSRIARRLPGRTDNEIKNYWRTHIKKKLEFNPPDHGLCSSFHNISNRALAKLNLTSSASTISVPSDLEKAVSPSSSTFQITPDIRVRRDGNSSPEIRIIEDVKRDYEFEFQQGVCDICSDREISDGCRPSALHDILLMNTLSYDFSSSEEDSLQRLELYEDGQENSSTFFLDGTEDLLKEDQSFSHYYSDVLWNLDDGGRHLVHPQL